MSYSPDFIFVGPSKSGSTWIFELLKSHPQVYVPAAKDLYFFDKFFDKGYSWYEKNFNKKNGEHIAGELSHDYFSSKLAIDRIYDYKPEIKIICCLRNPYDRALSSFKYFKRNGLVDKAFASAIIKYPEIINEGKYYTHLSYIFSKFTREQVLILFFDDLESSPHLFAERIFSFLEVDADFESPLIGQKINASSLPRSRHIAKLAKHTAVLLRKAGFPNLVGMIKRNNVVLNLLFKQEAQEFDHSSHVQNYKKYSVFSPSLIEIYNEEILKLEVLLGRQLNLWMVPLEYAGSK